MTNGTWVRIERLRTEGDLVIGPYPDEAAGLRALENALLIEGFCQEDAVDCFVSTAGPGTRVNDEAVLIDPNDPPHTVNRSAPPGAGALQRAVRGLGRSAGSGRGRRPLRRPAPPPRGRAPARRPPGWTLVAWGCIQSAGYGRTDLGESRARVPGGGAGARPRRCGAARSGCAGRCRPALRAAAA